ncbi:XrtA/PEP-CTERM system exopolysaccharide export protein, partial [Pelagibius sp.]|uniref:XrtA/PEP-CTERM system exopolysaccharide export protein n=1 Tax=Pelagibius sp. TaxID=1931238 RepID=UPI00260D4856
MIGEYAIGQGIACLFFVRSDVRDGRHVRRKAASAAPVAPPVRTGRGEGALSVLTDLFKGLHRRGQSGVLFPKFLSFLVLTAALLAGLTVPAAAPLAQAQQTYLIGPGDVLQVDVRRHEDLSTNVVVRPDGRISMPLVEDLLALGKTPEQVADDITERLSEFVIDPLVTVTVVSGEGDPRQQVRVVGEAADPQTLSYRSGMTLLDAIVDAGGLSREADGNGAVIVRLTNGSTREIPVRLADLVRDGDSTANVLLEPGDVIVIP